VTPQAEEGSPGIQGDQSRDKARTAKDGTDVTGRAPEGAGPAPPSAAPRAGDVTGERGSVRPSHSGGWWVAAALLLMYALLAGAPFIRGVPAAVGSVGITVIFILAVMIATADMALVRMSPLVEALGTLLCLMLWYVIAGVSEGSDLGRALLVPLADICFLVACVLCGRLLSRIIRERNLLPPVCVVLALADVFTVFFGPTALMLDKAPEVVTKLSVKLPQVGSAAGPQGAAGLVHLATMGPGDLVFLSLFFAAAVRFGLRLRATFTAILVLVAVGLAGVVLIPFIPAAPALPFMAVGFLIANRGEFKLTAQERRNVIIATVFFVVLVLAMWAVTNLAR